MQPMWGIPGSHSYCRFLRIARFQNTVGVARTGCLSPVNLLPSHSQDQQRGVRHELVLSSLCSKMTQPRGKRPCLPDFQMPPSTGWWHFQMPPSQCQYRVEQLLSASQIPKNFYNYLQFIWDFLLQILVIIIITIYLSIWLYQALVVTCRIFSRGMWDLAPWPGIEPEPPALGEWSFNHWTTGEYH